LLNWILITAILSSFLALAVAFVPMSVWISAAGGLAGIDTRTGSFGFLPAGVDWVLLAALVAYSGCGGITNMALSNWARDRGYGMGERVGYIPAAVGGKKVNLAHSGFMFPPDRENLERYRGWWRIVRADQWGIFFIGGILGMVRALTDILWTGSDRVRAWRGGDVRLVYYGVLAAVVLWGIVALRLAQPMMLLQIGANVAGVVFVITSLHVLYINTRLLPLALRPPLWRRAALVFMALFYGFFSALSISSLIG